MRLHRPDEFYARLGRDGLIGFGESYLTGAWDTDDLAGFLTVPAARMSTLIPESLQKLRALVMPRMPGHHQSTEANSQANISHHYDLSNDLFALFLDETLSYSSALFDTSLTSSKTSPNTSPGTPRDHVVATPPETSSSWGDDGDPLHHAPDFAEAQGRKIERMLDEAGVTDGTRVLEIGTGWGELAIRAARRGASVHTITLSVEQLELAEERIAAAGFADRVEVELMDYRALGSTGRTYDAVLSVEMIEAVGHEFWGTYFKTIDEVLAPGGRVSIQAITMPHDRMLATRGGHTWINKYIFPGGFLPSVEVIDEVTRDETTLRLVGQLEMGSHYAETLRRWDRRFLAQREAVLALGFDDMFMRVWHFYLALLPGRFRQWLHQRLAAHLHAGGPVTQTAPRSTTGTATAPGSPTASPRRVRPFIGGDLPVRLEAWDGSAAGPAGAPVVVLRSPDALRRLLWHPGELGAAQAYVTGELDVPEQDGWDLESALTHAFTVGAERGLSGVRLSPRALVDAIRTAAGLGALGRPPAPPASQARIKGRPAQPGPRPVLDQPPLRPLQRVLRAHPRAADGLQLRLPRDPRHAPRGGAARQARPGLHQARPRAGHEDARRRLWLGFAVAACRRALRGPGHRCHDRRGAEEVHRRPDRRAWAGGSGRDPAPGLPRGARARTTSTPWRRSRWVSTSARPTTRPTSRCCAARCAPVAVLVQQMSRQGAVVASTPAVGRSSSRSSRPT